MNEKSVFSTLEVLHASAPTLPLTHDTPVVVFSDLHLGNRGDRDDFLPNAGLFLHVLEEHYLSKGFTLVLNGDIEELKKFSLRNIMRSWGEVYRLFGRFAEAGKLHKIVGNHDQDLLLEKAPGGFFIRRLETGLKDVSKNPRVEGIFNDGHGYPFACTEALRIRSGGHSLLVYHGHQVSTFFRNYNRVSGWFNRYVLYPLGIMNRSVAHDKTKKYKVEKKVYDFSSRNRIVSIIGHTHRPLFESLSKIDTVRYRIESLCREYPAAGDAEKTRMESLIRLYKRELGSLYKNGKTGNRSSLYNSKVLVPCLFNSGCAVGKRGITSIEIAGGEISLVHWFDGAKSGKYLTRNDTRPERFGESDHYRMVLKKECLDYIFARIDLLS
jgi:predicted phosphodiesterase